ncbi:MAG: shikimate dehydrogenase [Kiritimatiellae bacterium]|nr:shikimate dehydrogenase [Kiritimatiellia bacterium]MDW8457652.1 shikimate dehydrogenase [Verrucomicrobiota bacterium]
MNITGSTRPFAVLGHPIRHTLSPAMHNAAFEALGWDAIYLAFDVKPDRLATVLPAMRSMGFGGVNLTIPHKEIAFRLLEHLDDSARLLGAVNTVQFAEDGRLVGHNTDGYGFLRALEEAFGRTVEGDVVFILGAGGAGRACALTAARHGARAVTLSDLDLERCRRVAEEIRSLFPAVEVHVAAGESEQTARAREADLVVQATPVGMKDGDESLLKPDAFRPGQRAFDLIYHLPRTVFMKAAAAGGAQTANGLGMLLHQGARAFTIWTGVEPPIEAMRSALRKAVYGI